MGQCDPPLADDRIVRMATPAWRRAYGLASAQFLLTGFHFGAMAPISPALEAEWTLQPAELGLLGSLLFYTYAAMQIPAGVLVDALGSRRMLILSALLTALGAGVFGAAPGLAVALVGRLFLGIGTGLIFTAGVRHITRVTSGQSDASERFNTFFGPFVGLNYVGVALASIPLVLIVTAVGWRPPLLVASGLSAVLAALIWMLPGSTSEPVTSGSREQLVTALTIWYGDRTIWVYTLIRFTYGSFVGMQTLWVVPLLLVTFRLAQEAVGLVLLAMALGQAIGPGLGAWFATRSGRPVAVLTATTGTYTAICLALLALVQIQSGLTLVLVAFFVLAVAQSATLIGFGLVTARIRPQFQGTVSGIVNVGPWLGSAVFQLAAGYLVQSLLARPGATRVGTAYAATLALLAVVGLAAIPLTRLLEEEKS